jgi:hypothetical protein
LSVSNASLIQRPWIPPVVDTLRSSIISP